jgi:hypothetical protein
MQSGQTADRGSGSSRVPKRGPVAAVCLSVVLCVSPGFPAAVSATPLRVGIGVSQRGFPVQTIEELKAMSRSGARDSVAPKEILKSDLRLPDVASVLREAFALADNDELDRAGSLLSRALIRWPDHPELLAALAGLRIRQGSPAAAELLASHLVRLDPASGVGWELLGASRYLQDDARGALKAWASRQSPVVRGVNLRVFGRGTPSGGSAPSPLLGARWTGISSGDALTEEVLILGERRLGSLPAASRSRLTFRMLPGGEASLDGTVVLGETNPFSPPTLPAHALRLLGRRVQIGSAAPLGGMDRWELSGSVEGSLRAATFAVAHPAPLGKGVWQWTVDHGSGRYRSEGGSASTREERSGVSWSHADWVTATLRAKGSLYLEQRPGHGTFAGAGMNWTRITLSDRGSVGAEAMGWSQVDRRSERGPTSFGRLALAAALLPRDPPGIAMPSGLALRAGVVTVSRGAPQDLLPRAGAARQASMLMRAGSDLDPDGAVRALFPGRGWAHGGVEVLQAVGTVGPLGVGVAAFADGVRVLGPSGLPTGDRGALHVGVGLRARVPGLSGWLRADWGIDPFRGSDSFSAGWVPGAS